LARVRHRLFCYGTLQIPDVIHAVVGRHFRGRQAVLDGYTALTVRGAEYPGLRPLPGRHTAGQVYSGLSEGELAILDRFEGRLYTRRRLTVRLADSRRRGVWVYVVKPTLRRRLSPVNWDRREFRRRRFRRFMRRFVHERRAVFDPGRG
jgi:gamma-glutamylcyclotransferase (GGCT)/AIG2-like uncharacterized protein YtfP